MTDTPTGPRWSTPPLGPSTGAGSDRSLPPPAAPPVVPTAPPTRARAATAPPNAPLRSVPTGVAGTLCVSFWVLCGLSVVAVLLVIGNLLAFDAWWDTPIGSGEAADALRRWVRAEDVLQAVGGVAALAGLVAFGLLLVWANRAHRASQELWSGRRSWTSGWSVGGWFIPLANAVIPKLMLGEIERIATAPRSGGRVREGWRTQRTSTVGWVWWIATIAGTMLNLAGNALGRERDSSAGEVRLGYVFNGVGLTSIAVGMAAGALFVGRLSARLTTEGLREQT